MICTLQGLLSDNPIANTILIKQLQRYDINVVSTINGSQAVKEWEKHPVGFFDFALFDHRMCHNLL